MKQVFFYSLPMGAEFLHKGKKYRKTGEEEVLELGANKEWVFEIHYGCLVPEMSFPESVLRE